MPQLITAEEARALKKRPLGRKHFVRTAIEMMEAGQILLIAREEFTWKEHTPRWFCNEIASATRKKFTVMKLADRKGWLVERVE